jgi:hypothetical protein
MIEGEIGIFEDGFGTSIDVALANLFDWEDIGVQHVFIYYIQQSIEDGNKAYLVEMVKLFLASSSW